MFVTYVVGRAISDNVGHHRLKDVRKLVLNVGIVELTSHLILLRCHFS